MTPIGDHARQNTLEAIGAFLLKHDLKLTGDSLSAAYSIVSGSNPGLERQIAERLAKGLQVTDAWLEEVTAKTDQNDISKLVARLEITLEGLSHSTHAARSATSDYTVGLQKHVAQLDQVDDSSDVISSLATLAKSMLERAGRLEQEMRRSEREAATLRNNLAKAKRDAEVDHLTGLPNRRAFEMVLEQEYREARGALDPLVVAFCDIDHFKHVNDTHGHDAGDRVIRTIAEMLATISNDKCHVARHGGEEFVMLFRGASIEEARQKLDEVRESMAKRRLVNRKTDTPFGQITFSAGIANVFDFADPRSALRAADQALYLAKENGRNQIQMAAKTTP